ncbi:MAG: GNAT family N-acetyltransferase [Capsulimonadaceae bacterium]|nr:GNAT family N-acetyltransferase [Capsulimonadaceae bacterium]
MTATIRRAQSPEDGLALIGLIRSLADFENLPGPDDDAVKRFIAHGFERQPPLYEAYLAEDIDAGAIGYVIFFQTYSTFLCKPSLYVEDLFVLPEHRGAGIGKLLLTRCIQIATERDCGRVEWTVLDWNTAAQEFYKSLGAKHLSEWHLYRLMVS